MNKRASFVAVYLLLTCLTGCATTGAKSDTEPKAESEWFENLKSLKGTGESTGLSRQSREIEKSLGGF